MRRAVSIVLTDQERVTLLSWARSRTLPARLCVRAQIVLAAAEGRENQEIADALGLHRDTVAQWRRRFSQQRVAGIERETPPELDLHLILDHYATHKHSRVKAWLTEHPRFHLHFIPTSSSWLNLVERFFREIITKRIRRGAFRSVAALQQAIQEYLAAHNAQPKPFIWTADLKDIWPKIARAHAALDTARNQ